MTRVSVTAEAAASVQVPMLSVNFVDSVVLALAAVQHLKQQEAEAVIQMWDRRLKVEAAENEKQLIDLEDAQFANMVVDDHAASKLPEVCALPSGCSAVLDEFLTVLRLPVSRNSVGEEIM